MNYIQCVQKFNGRVGGLKVKAVDTTGAGDAFVSGILCSLASNLNLFQVCISTRNFVRLGFKKLNITNLFIIVLLR